MTLKQNSESATPEHYQKDGQDLLSHLEHIMTEDEMRGAYRFNIIKYATRAGRKDDIVLEIDKIIEYAKRWKEFEESKKNSSPFCKDSIWSKNKYGDFNPVLQFTEPYWEGEQILSYINEFMSDNREYRLIFNGSPVCINDYNNLHPDDGITCYSKEQLMAFFKKREDSSFSKGLEILVKKL